MVFYIYLRYMNISTRIPFDRIFKVKLRNYFIDDFFVACGCVSLCMCVCCVEMLI